MGKRHQPPKSAAPVELSRRDDGMVRVHRDDLRQLLLAADVVSEHHTTLIDTTPSVTGTDTLLVLHEAGIVDADTLDVCDAFRAAMARCGRALGTGEAPRGVFPAAGGFGG